MWGRDERREKLNNLDATNTALAKIIGERARQLTQEGYTPEHDDEHTEGQMALLAAAYALSSRGEVRLVEYVEAVLPDGWPIKPKGAIRDLVRAGALILAELERRLRLLCIAR